MTDWPEFLKRLSHEVLADESVRSMIPAEMIKAGWLGYPPATETELVKLEKRLKTELPPSYREFLLISNGWKFPGTFIHDLLSADKVDWFRKLHGDWIEAWLEGEEMGGGRVTVTHEQHCVYGPEQDCCNFRTEYWKKTLTISDIGDSAIYLLNPKVVDGNGEWESWFFANWKPGATRYRSFWELMQAELEALIRLRNTNP